MEECPTDRAMCLMFGHENCTCDGERLTLPAATPHLGKLGIYSVISFVSLIGNLVFVIVIWRSRKLHTVTHLLMTNLGVANLGFVLMSTPIFTSRYLLQTEWVLGGVVCKLSMSAIHLTATASFYAMALVAVDRWLAVFRSRDRLTKTNSLVLTCALWSVSLAVASPYIYFANVDSEAFRPSCKIACNQCLKSLELATVVIQYVVPLLITIPAYSHLAVFLCLRKEIGSEDRQRHAHAKKLKVVGILMAILTVFTAAWTPLLIITLLLVYQVYVPDFTVFIWCFVLASLGVALTPILYMLNDSFRLELFALCNCFRRKSRRRGIDSEIPTHTNIAGTASPNSRFSVMSPESPKSALIRPEEKESHV